MPLSRAQGRREQSDPFYCRCWSRAKIRSTSAASFKIETRCISAVMDNDASEVTKAVAISACGLGAALGDSALLALPSGTVAAPSVG